MKTKTKHKVTGMIQQARHKKSLRTKSPYSIERRFRRARFEDLKALDAFYPPKVG